MTRKEFIKICALLGVSIPFQTTLSSCKGDDTHQSNFNGKVLIIGAGVAGLSAGHLLKQEGIDFKILEASTNIGGRLKTSTDFTDFPIPLGAEWLHIDTSIFNEIVNDNSVHVDVNTVGYNTSDSYGLWQNGQLSLSTIGTFEDRKFVNGSWLDFYERYIIPSVIPNLINNAVVQSIDYSREKIKVSTQNDEYEADKVIVTVPLSILKNNDITFTPTLPSEKQNAINAADMWPGIKVFIEFSDKFYPTFTEFKITPANSGETVYYDAAYGQNTNKHIMGMFAIGEPANNYISLDENELIDYILNELDEIFDQQASANYTQHITQNWTKEPFIKGGYLSDHEDSRRVETLFEDLDNKIYFAGEAYTNGNDWGGVHAAARAAKDTVLKIL